MGAALSENLHGGLKSLYGRARANQIFVMSLVAVLLLLVGTLVNASFISASNIGSILALATLLAFAASGQTLVIVVGGGIDISAGSMMSFGAIIAVEVMKGQNANILPALFFIVLAGAFVGLVNAAGIILARVPPLIMTLAMANVVVSMQLLFSGGTPSGKPASIVSYLGTVRPLSFLPWLFVVALVVIFLVQFLLNRTSFGKQLFATGSNDNAALLVGIRTHRIRALVYLLSGVFSGVAGFWFAAYNTFVNVNIANHFVLPSVAAVLIGGTPFSGGKGSFGGTMVGAIVLTLVSSLLVMLKTDEAGRQIFNGVILVVLLALYNREPALRS